MKMILSNVQLEDLILKELKFYTDAVRTRGLDADNEQLQVLYTRLVDVFDDLDEFLDVDYDSLPKDYYVR